MLWGGKLGMLWGTIKISSDTVHPPTAVTARTKYPRIKHDAESLKLGGQLEKTQPRKKIAGNLNFCPAVIAKNSLNASPGSALDVLCHFQFWQQDPVANNDTLAKNSDANT
jgi:hypothetical protein